MSQTHYRYGTLQIGDAVEWYYELDANPADNPYQPPANEQGEHKIGARAQVAEMQAKAEFTEAATAPIKGDVVFDYSSAKPTDAQLKAGGAKGVCRYLSPLNADGSDYGPTLVKIIQTPEYKWHLDNTRYVRKNYEWYEGRMGEGAPAGTQDAYWAGTKAWKLDQAVSVNPDTEWWAKWIIFSDDTGGTSYAAVKAYMLAAYAQLQKMPGKYLPDYYGRQAIYKLLLDDPDIHWIVPGWQTCAWSGGVYGGFADPDHAAAMYQALCVPVTPNIPGCDTNFVMQPQKFEGEDMPLSQDDLKAIGALIDHRIVRTVAYLVGMAPSGNTYVNDSWDIPASPPFPAATNAWSFFNDPKAITLDEITKAITLVLRGDVDANGQPKPPAQNTHPANITFIYDIVKDLPTEIPPLSDAQIQGVVNALLSAAASGFKGDLTLTPIPAPPPVSP